MMYIEYKSNPPALSASSKLKEWHVGDHVSTNMLDNLVWVYMPDIVQADGDELEWIRSNFPGLVIPNGPVVRFFGDTARLIAGNLPESSSYALSQ